MTLPEAEARMQEAKALLRDAQNRRAIASSAAWQASLSGAEHERLKGLWYEACKAAREAQAEYEAARKAFAHIVKRKPRK